MLDFVSLSDINVVIRDKVCYSNLSYLWLKNKNVTHDDIFIDIVPINLDKYIKNEGKEIGTVIVPERIEDKVEMENHYLFLIGNSAYLPIRNKEGKVYSLNGICYIIITEENYELILGTFMLKSKEEL
jgi:hypothetical protein